MFKLNEIYEVNRSKLKYDSIRYNPAKISKINTAYCQILINIPREDSVICLLNSNPDFN